MKSAIKTAMVITMLAIVLGVPKAVAEDYPWQDDPICPCFPFPGKCDEWACPWDAVAGICGSVSGYCGYTGEDQPCPDGGPDCGVQH